MKSLGTGIRFRLPGAGCIPRPYESLIHGEWIDRNPLPIHHELQQDSLLVSYSYQESLRIVVPWEISGLGVFFLKTVSLPKSEQTYDLLLELARGTVGRLVDQTENWKASGLILPGELEKQIDLVKLNFRRATFSEDQERWQFAMVAIEVSIHMMNEVGMVFAHYVLQLRKQEKQPNTTLIGAPYYENNNDYENQTGEVTPFADLFNLALISTRDLQENPAADLLSKLHGQGITTCSSPFFDFRRIRKAESGSIDEAEGQMISRANSQLELGLDNCKLMMPVSSLGFDGSHGWNDHEQIHLAYELLSSIKNRYPQTPLVVGIDQPFGESRISSERKSPLQLADNLIRMQAPIAAFSLEINIGYYPQGTWIRDLYAFNDLLDSWAQFDCPLVVQLRIPGGVRAREVEDGTPLVAAGLDSQASWLENLALLAMAKHNVAGVLYAQVFDQVDDPFFGAGLVSSQMKEKPAMVAIRNIGEQISGGPSR